MIVEVTADQTEVMFQCPHCQEDFWYRKEYSPGGEWPEGANYECCSVCWQDFELEFEVKAE